MSILRASVVIFASALLLNLRQTAAQSVSASTPVIGTVNGQPLHGSNDRTGAVTRFRITHLRAPSSAADEQEIDETVAKSQCGNIRASITIAATTTETRRLGITAPPEEVQKLKAAYLKSHDLDAEAKQERDETAALITALNEVYEHGMDQHQAYEKYLAPRGYLEGAWQGNLASGSSPEWRSKWVLREGITAAALSQGLDAPLTRRVEREHLDAAVDKQIASVDQTFRAYLDEERQGTVAISPFETSTRGASAAHMQYLRTKRAEWWQAREAEVKVVINDPALAKQCGMGTDGRPLPAKQDVVPARPRVSGPPPGSPVPITIAPTAPQK
jgi:hypothetical protein